MVTILAAFVLAFVGFEAAAQTSKQAGGELQPGKLRSGSIRTDSETSSVSYSIKVGPSVWAVRLKLQDVKADLDLIVYNQDDEEVWRAEESMFNEELLLWRLGDPELYDGTFRVDVLWQYDGPATIDGKESKLIEFNIDYEVFTTSVPTPLQTGTVVRETLTEESVYFRMFQLPVSKGTTAVRFDLWDAQADLDYYVFDKANIADPELALWEAVTTPTRESLVITELPRTLTDRGGNLYVLVVCSLLDEDDISFNFLASRSAAVDTRLTALPSLTALAQADGKQRAFGAVVEVFSSTGGGTGSVLTADGYVLTNFHVAESENGTADPWVAVGFTLDPALAAESDFKARLIRADKPRDLALYKIETGFYDQALPAGIRFPAMELAKSSQLSLGDEINIVGYPVYGGLSNRSTITISRGIVAGLVTRTIGKLIKTDAEITNGNSGGAALTRDWRLVAVPTLVYSNDGSQLGYLYPLDLVDASWWTLMGIKAP